MNLFEGKKNTSPFIGSVNASSRQISGSATEDEGSSAGLNNCDDRNTKMTIYRTDEGCVWAYENESAVYVPIQKIVKMNRGFDILGDNKDAISLIETKYRDNLEDILPSIIENRSICAWAPTLIKKDKLMILDPKECKPIIDLNTNELGYDVSGRKNIGIVQDGHLITYNEDGSDNKTQQYFYHNKNDVIPFNVLDRGRFRGQSAVMRILRLVEIVKNIENITEMVIRRFGPQLIAKFGNSDYNFSNIDIPKSYLRGTDGNNIDPDTAMATYKKDIMTGIDAAVREFVDGSALMMKLEYGIDVESLNPSSAMPLYTVYISLFKNMIKNTILGVYASGRMDVTSAAMMKITNIELREAAEVDLNSIAKSLNNLYINKRLRENGFKEKDAYIKFRDIDNSEELGKIEIEELLSRAVKNYAQHGLKIPKRLIDIIGEPLKVPKPIAKEVKKEEDIKKEEKKDVPIKSDE